MKALSMAPLIVGKTLVAANYDYRRGDEHVTLRFEDPEAGKAIRLSITAERGSSLWLKTRRVPARSKSSVEAKDTSALRQQLAASEAKCKELEKEVARLEHCIAGDGWS